MLIKNTNNPTIGFADFALFCDHCGDEIGDDAANLEFSHLRKVFCLHKGCSRAFRAKNNHEKFYWVELKEARLSVRDGVEFNKINLK